MKKIDVSTPKHPNAFALVDDEDYERVIAGPKWFAWKGKTNKTLYAVRRIRINGKSTAQYMHRFILSVPPGIETDHVNMIGLDNRKNNLRQATVSQNNCNRAAFKNNKSGCKGIYWSKRAKKWRAGITHNKRSLHLGYFKSAEEAHEAYKAAAHQLHSEFARAA